MGHRGSLQYCDQLRVPMEFHIMPGFSIVVMVLAACASLTSVQSQHAFQGMPFSSGTEKIPVASSGTCASSRAQCMNLKHSSMDSLNRQVNLELSAFYSYMAMGSYFSSVDGAMRGTALFFRNQAQEELAHANQFMDYIILRGGDLKLSDIRTPNATRFTGILDAMQHALEMEIHVTDALLNMYDVATENNDPSLADFLDGNFIAEQVDSMDQLAHHVAVLKRMVGDPVGEYMFDERLHQSLQNSVV